MPQDRKIIPADIDQTATNDFPFPSISTDQERTKSEPVYNVKHPAFGAVGNNSTDDSAAIQAAIDAAENAGGGTVYFPVGNYIIQSGLTLPYQTKIALVGSTLATSRLRAGSSLSTAMLSLTGGSGSTSEDRLEDLYFGAYGHNPPKLVDLSQTETSTRFKIERCDFDGRGMSGGYVLDMSGNEDSYTLNCATFNGRSKWNVSGGLFNDYGSEWFGGLDMVANTANFHGSVFTNGINVTATANPVQTLNLDGVYVNPPNDGNAVVRNNSGGAVNVTARGGYWIQTSGNPFFGGSNPVHLSMESMMFSSNDGSTTDVLSVAGSTVNHDRNLQLNNGSTLPSGYYQVNWGNPTFSGDGSTTSFSVPHGLASSPSIVLATPVNSVAASNNPYVTWGSTDITIHFTAAPGTGTSAIMVWWATV